MKEILGIKQQKYNLHLSNSLYIRKNILNS